MSTNKYLRPGDKAPNFSAEAVLPSLEFEHISLNRYANRWLLLFSYPKNFTFVAPTEIAAFSERVKEFEKYNCSILGLSTESVYAHFAWRTIERKRGGLGDIDVPIIGDITKSVAKSFGLYNEKEGSCYSGMCLINPKGVIMAISYNSPEVGRSIDEALEIIEQCQSINERSMNVISVQMTATKVEEKIENNESKDKVAPQTRCCVLL